MEELQPQDIENLLQELEEEDGTQESPAPDVEELLRALQSGSVALDRLAAAEELGNVRTSHPRIVRALIAAGESDPYLWVNRAAARSLRAPVHQEYLQQHPDLMEAAEKVLQQHPRADRQLLESKKHGRETSERAVARKPATPPAHFRVETEGDTLCVTWRPNLRQRLENAWVAMLLLLLSIFYFYSLSGGASYAWFTVSFSAVALGSAYWIMAVMANTTRVLVGKEEWMFQRGPFPLPMRRFYVPVRRLDPTACRRVWTDRVEEIKQRWSGSGGSGGGSLGCALALLVLEVLLLAALSEQNKKLVVTYKLYARSVAGGDQELLPLLSQGEAGYLEQKLQPLLEGGDGPQMGE